MNDPLKVAAAKVMRLLASKDYRGLEALTRGKRLSSRLIEQAIDEFGRTVIEPTPDAYARLDVVEITGAVPRRWSVNMPVWTAELGESDLEVQMTMTADGDHVRVQLDGILVP